MINATASGIGQQRKRSRGSRWSGREESRTGGRGNILETWGENERTRKRSIKATLNNRHFNCDQLNIEKVIKLS
jgi:hypothetical protein